MGALFGQINSAGDKSATAAFGLKKVDDSQKAKNMKDKPALAPSEKKETKKSEKKEEKKGEPKMMLDKGTWFCENQENAVLEIKDCQMKQNVYISKCTGSQITIPDKCKSIQIVACEKCAVKFKSIVSTVEVTRSKKISITVDEVLPAIAIDKSDAISLILSKEAAAKPPEILTSNTNEINLVVPGKTDKDDPVEMALPEQFSTRYNPETRKITTETVNHGAG